MVNQNDENNYNFVECQVKYFIYFVTRRHTRYRFRAIDASRYSILTYEYSIILIGPYIIVDKILLQEMVTAVDAAQQKHISQCVTSLRNSISARQISRFD